MITKLEHIAIAVKDLENAVALWESLLGTPAFKIEAVDSQKVITAFFKVGDIKIELLAATDASSTISRFIDQKGEGLHHIAFETTDLEKESSRLENLGFSMIGNEPSPGAENKTIRFMKPASTKGVLVEFCEDRVPGQKSSE